MLPPRSNSDRKLFGLLTRRERWGLSGRGVLILLVSLALVVVAWFFAVYPFFAVTERVETRLLVVEGWIRPYAIEAAVKEFGSGSYERVFTTGGPVQGLGGYINDFNTSASVGADRLKAAGLPAALVQMVPSRVTARDRTYSSAIAFRTWCRENNVPLTSINIVTEGVHARRTRLLFQRALGDSVTIGIIAVHNPDFDPKRWWRFSEGVRAVMGECIVYLYARIVFVPDRE